MPRRIILSLMILFCVVAIARASRGVPEDAGVKGGVVVVLGGDASLHDKTIKATEHGPYLVQFLDTDAQKVKEAREYIQKKGIYGAVSARAYDGKNLPYIDNLVNLIVAYGPTSKAQREEIERVLVPGGIALFSGSSTNLQPLTANHRSPPALKGWSTFKKPWPADIDQWSHWMHGPENNPVAADTKIDVPRNLQWVQGPKWISSHNLNPGVSAMVTSGGRVFSIINEMPPGIKGMKDKWMLTARDAFNGIVLWRRPIKDWGWTHWSEMEESVEMRFVPPFQVMRRLVAAENRLFVTPGFYSPVHVLDAATGKEVKVLEGTEKTFEILHLDGLLYLAVNDSLGTGNMIPAISVMAVNPETGKTLWKTGGFRGISGKLNSLYKHANAFLTAGSGNITLLSGDALVALDQKTGKERWRAPRPGKRVELADDDIKSLAVGRARSPKVPNYRAHQFFPNNCAIVHSDGVIVLTEIKDEVKNYKTRLEKSAYTAAYDAASGEELWCTDSVTFAHFVPPDLFVIDGLAWTLDGESKSYVGLDLRTGEKKKSYPVETLIWRSGGHQLCFRNKATTEMIVFGRRKSEFIDIHTGKISKHAWIKGMCNYGVMPANGMIYYPPHNCSCYMPMKNTGFRAQTAHGSARDTSPARLVKGKGYGKSFNSADRAGKQDWPMYRGDASRKGSSPGSLPTKPALRWTTELGGALSQVVSAGGKLYVAEKDAHRICCLDGDKGTVLWKYTASGRIDSAPTYFGGRILAGCRDGHVYCLDADTGDLVWRFRGAPHDASLVAYDQLESVWPIHGSLVVRNDKVYCLAGRSAHLNGGMYLYVLDLDTGKPVQEKKLVPNLDSDYESEQGLLSDLMVVDRDLMRVRHMAFDADDIEKLAFVKGSSRGPSIKSSLSPIGGFLDESWFNTTVWAMGSARGQVMTFDTTHAFGLLAHKKFGQSCGHDIFRVGQNGYLLFCKSLAGKDGTPNKEPSKGKGRGKGRRKTGGKTAYLWSSMVPIRGEAILAAENCLYLAGTRDAVDEEDPWAHVEGRKGGVLAVYARADGKKLAEVSLSSAPVFDGMSASSGNVFLVTRDGKINCYK
jgi:outer membrane protein assembly factor BamB